MGNSRRTLTAGTVTQSELRGQGRRTRQARLFESLESRVLLSVSGLEQPFFKLGLGSGGEIASASASPSGLSPATVRHAYGVDMTLFGAIVGDGTGQTIAIVDAYDLPTAATDLAAFSTKYGLPQATFKKYNQLGQQSNYPAPDAKGGWGVEIALDIEWAHAIAPKATIVLVEADSAYSSDMFAAVDTARNLPGVSVVSMSWGGDESPADLAYDTYLTTPVLHGGVTFIASAGDNGAYSPSSPTSKIVSHPAASSLVLSVGGTRLTTGAGGIYVSETAWGSGSTSGTYGGAGGGISKYFSQPAYQNGIVTQTSTKRAVPDVGFLADPVSGVPVYDSYDNGASTPWLTVGGTSLAAPMWAGVIAIANQGRALSGLNALAGTEAMSKLYTLPQSDFHDITTGNNGYPAVPGYDLVTGRGTPIVNLLAPDLVGVPDGTPMIGSLTINPSIVAVGGSVTLTANNVDVVGDTISTVQFYRETNGVSGLQVGSDMLLGTGLNSGSDWSLSVSTVGQAAGYYTYYAVATAVGGPTAKSSATLTIASKITSGPISVGWDMNYQYAFGAQGFKATTTSPVLVNTRGLTRGLGVTVSGSGTKYSWGGNGWASTSALGIAKDKVVTFGFTVGVNSTASFSSIGLNYLRTITGPSSALWQYQLDGGAWVTIGNFINQFPSTATTGATMTPVNLSGIDDLQNLSEGTQVVFRIVPFGATAPGGTWYINNKTGNDLVANANGTAVQMVAPAKAAAVPANITAASTIPSVQLVGVRVAAVLPPSPARSLVSADKWSSQG